MIVECLVNAQSQKSFHVLLNRVALNGTMEQTRITRASDVAELTFVASWTLKATNYNTKRLSQRLRRNGRQRQIVAQVEFSAIN